MLESLFEKTVDVYRLMADDDESPSDTEEYAAYLSGVACQIQPLDDSFRETGAGAYGKDFLMFCAAVDIQEKDRIIDGLDSYVVSGVESYDFAGHSHMEVRITKTE